MTLSLTMRAEAMRDAEGWSGACGGDDGVDDDDGDDDGGIPDICHFFYTGKIFGE